MKMAQLLLEIYCEETEGHCIYGNDRMGIHCFENKCNYLSYTYSPNELAYSGDKGLVIGEDSFIGFGGEMDADPDKKNYEKERQEYLKMWEEVCKEKIDDAYRSYINYRNGM